MWWGVAISLTGLGCWPQGRGMLLALHTVITTSTKQLTRHSSLDISTVSLHHYLRHSQHWAFWTPSGMGCNPSMLLPAGTLIRSDGVEATRESLSLQAHCLFERCHIHVPQCMMRVQQAYVQCFSLSYEEASCWRQKISPMWSTHVQILNMKLLQRHIFLSLFFKQFPLSVSVLRFFCCE